MPVRSKCSVVCVTAQPLPSPPIEVGVVAHGFVDEHLVEHRLAGHLAQRPDRDAGLVEREREPRDARVLRYVEVGAGEQHPVVGLACACCSTPSGPLMIQRSPSRSARVVSPARSEPAPGSLNSWHQPSCPSRIGGTWPRDLVGRAVREDRRRGHEQAEPTRRLERAIRRRTPRGRSAATVASNPRPPCSVAKCGAVQPAAPTMRHHSSTSRRDPNARRATRAPLP